jgi:hypothetical protein
MRFEVGERRSLRKGIEALLALSGQRGSSGAALDQLEHAKAHEVLRPKRIDVWLAVSHAAQGEGFVAAEVPRTTLNQERIPRWRLLQVADRSVDFSSIFGSWGLLAGFIPSVSRIALLRRFKASSRAEPSVTILEICMACTLLSKHDS